MKKLTIPRWESACCAVVKIYAANPDGIKSSNPNADNANAAAGAVLKKSNSSLGLQHTVWNKQNNTALTFFFGSQIPKIWNLTVILTDGTLVPKDEENDLVQYNGTARSKRRNQTDVKFL
ncbi:hypothetical protein HNY73_006216 [Argiope bruennichi]|uniref:Uncharacterized protein n=1 Tax=Argiope bruennichi TaxID=94029 RepID=A0A8T0FNY2_ARGBR|nr:hypothetical protein HNY73_006216 [Argiope bruennichi]